jgi:sporadic carbohydrate cluster 2OG-Fe(II) oxygenase
MQNSMIQNFFLKNGYYIFNLNKPYLMKLKNILSKEIKSFSKLKKINLDYFHNDYPSNKINKLRMHLYKKINLHKKFSGYVLKSSEKIIHDFVGNELATSNINLSIQLPKDKSSLLKMHTDFFAGESLFQSNIWIPFVDVKKTNSMFIIDPKNTIKILKQVKNNPRFNFLNVEKKYKTKLKWLKLKFGQGLIFSPNCLHGNIVNNEKTTRWSINVRYKNIFSPYAKKYVNEKKIGNFYKVSNLKIITKFNLKHNFDEFEF